MSNLPHRTICIGAMLWDVIGRSEQPLATGDDVPGKICQVPGGVALNVASRLVRHGVQSVLLSSVGRDGAGDALIAAADARGVDTSMVWRDPVLPTGTYVAIETGGGLVAAIADARALEAAGSAILTPLRDGQLGLWDGPVVLDCNLSVDVLTEIAMDPSLAQADLRIVPASPGKAARLQPLLSHPRALFYLNLAEARIISGENAPDAAAAAEAVVRAGAARAVVTNGTNPAADAVRDGVTLTADVPAVIAARITGAGDSFLAGHLAVELNGADRQSALDAAVLAASEYVSGKDMP